MSWSQAPSPHLRCGSVLLKPQGHRARFCMHLNLAELPERWSAPMASFGAKPHWRPDTAQSVVEWAARACLTSHGRSWAARDLGIKPSLSELRSVGDLLKVALNNLPPLLPSPPTHRYMLRFPRFGTNHPGHDPFFNIL